MKNNILYSFRRCPYAMRARLALSYADIKVEIREITLKNKPQEMLTLSPKGTVPVLVLSNGTVIDESIDIMLWALQRQDCCNWLPKSEGLQWDIKTLIDEIDSSFKPLLDKYKYADRFPEHPPLIYRRQAEKYISLLNERLATQLFLTGDAFSLADGAIFPFIRQFSKVDENWFKTSPYPHLNKWLEKISQSEIFLRIMKKYPEWKQGSEAVYLTQKMQN